MDDLITTALRERAEGDVHVERLLGAVHAGVRRQRRRRFAVGCGVCAAVTAVVVAGLPATPPDRGPDTLAAPPVAAFPRPPSAAPAPTAAEVPAVLGSDPALFHLDVTGLTGWRYASWASTRKFEELAISADETGGVVRVSAARDPEWLGPRGPDAEPVTVAGQPAETWQQQLEYGRSHTVRWQPRPGIWAQVEAHTLVDIAINVAEGVRLDRVYRCAVPFRLTALALSSPAKCSTDFLLEDAGRPATAGGSAWFTVTPGGPEYQVWVGSARPGAVVNDTIDGRAVQVAPPSADGSTPPEILYPYDGRMAYFWQHGAGPPEALRAVVAAFTPVPGGDPAGWPNNPFAP